MDIIIIIIIKFQINNKNGTTTIKYVIKLLTNNRQNILSIGTVLIIMHVMRLIREVFLLLL